MTKEELKEYRKLLLEFKGIQDTLKSITYINSPLMTEIRTNRVVSLVENIIFRVLKLEEEYKDKQEELTKKLDSIESFIEGIEDTTVRNIFRRRYILGERWEDVSKSVYMSEKHCRRLHDKYLNK